MNGMIVATDLSVYKEAYLTFKDNNDYAVRVKSAPLYGQDSAKQGEVTFSLLSYDAKLARKIKEKTFLISVIREYPDAASDETVIFTGNWDLFELSAELEYTDLSVAINQNLQKNIASIESLSTEKANLELEISTLEAIISTKEIEKNSLETILNQNLAKLSSLKTSGRTIEGGFLNGSQTTEGTPSDIAETNKKANVLIPVPVGEMDIKAMTMRGSIRNIISESTNTNFK
jgi:hypothetical protein